MGAPRYTTLDSLRGICALIVVLFHYPIHDSPIRTFPLVAHGYLFVDFFFVLSGFVIAFVYEKKLVDGERSWKFIVRRFGRIWPLHAAILALFVTASVFKGELGVDERHAVDAIFTNLLMVQGLGFHSDLTFNGPSWSISVEWMLYIVFAALSFSPWRAWIYFGLMAVGVAMLTFVAPHGQGSTFDYGIFRGLAGFFAGCLFTRLKPIRMTTWGEALAALAVILFVSFGVLLTLAPIVFGFAVYVFSSSNGAISRALNLKPFTKLGEWSYSIYMVHSTVVAVMLAFGLFGSGFGLPLLLTLTIGGSALTYTFIEDPARKLFNRLADRRPRVAMS